MKHIVDFNGCVSHEDIIQRLNFVFELSKDDKVDITLDFYAFRDFIYPDYAILIIAMIDYARQKAKNLKGRIINLKKKSNTFKYLNRMNFFKLLGANFDTQVSYKDNGDFLEISKYTEPAHGDIIEKIINIIRKNLVYINDNVLISLDYCLGEILDNVSLYSGKKEGYVVVQYYSFTSKIRLLICDTGDGIHTTLNAEKEFKLSPQDSINCCIEEDVSGGKGQGHGLFATSTFIEENRGGLKIISDEYVLNFKTFEEREVLKCPYWKGTIVYMDINTNVEVDYKKFTSRSFDQKDVFVERFESLW